MGFRYFWKDVTEDGLLKEPRVRTHSAFTSSEVNTYYGFSTEAEACAAFDQWNRDHKYDAPAELVLIRVYRANEDR